MKIKFRSKPVILFLMIYALVGGILIHFKADKKETELIYEGYCPTDNIITVRHGGRLGNCVWEYISALGIGESLYLHPYVPKSIVNCLSKVFKNIKIPAYEKTLLSNFCRITHKGNVRKCELQIFSQKGTKWNHLCYTLKYGKPISHQVAYKPIASLIKLHNAGQLPSIIILPKYIAQCDAFLRVGISRLKEEFQFHKDIRLLAEATLNGVKKEAGCIDIIFVGIHVRRTDYQSYLIEKFGDKVAFADHDYYKRAMNRMLDLYNGSKIIFVVVSDDYEWCKKNLVNETEGVYWGGLEESRFITNWREKRDLGVGHDLAVLALQNHSIIGYGTFGVTGSLLSGGHTIVSHLPRFSIFNEYLTTDLSKVLPNWESI